MNAMTMMLILTCLHATDLGDTTKTDGISEVTSMNKESGYIFENEQEAETLLSLLTSASVNTKQRKSLIEAAVDSVVDYAFGKSPKIENTKEQLNEKRKDEGAPKWMGWIKMLAEESLEQKKITEAGHAMKMVETHQDRRISKVFAGFKEREVLNSRYSDDSKSTWNISKIQFNEVSYLVVAFTFKQSPLDDVQSTAVLNKDLKIGVHTGIHEEFITQNMAKNVPEKLFEIWKNLPKYKQSTTKIIFTGHSLGGGLAQIMGAYAKDKKSLEKHARFDENFKESLKRSIIKTFGSPQIFNMNIAQKEGRIEKFWRKTWGGEEPLMWKKDFEQDSVHFMNHDDIVPFFLQNVPYQGEAQGILKNRNKVSELLKTLAERANKAKVFEIAKENNYKQSIKTVNDKWREIVKVSVKSAIDSNDLPNAAELMELLMIDKSVQNCVQEYTKTDNTNFQLFNGCKGVFAKNPRLSLFLMKNGWFTYSVIQSEKKTINYTVMGRRYMFTNDSLKKVDEKGMKKDSLSNLKDAVQNLFEGTGINAYMKNFLSFVRPTCKSDQEKCLKTINMKAQKSIHVIRSNTILESPKEEFHRNFTIFESPKEKFHRTPTISESAKKEFHRNHKESNSCNFRLAFSITMFCVVFA